jgi:GGDEF domain-containing protein
MISIRESISDLERIDELNSASLECYRSALQAMAQYAIEFEDGATGSYRKHMAALSGDLRGKADAPRLFASRSVLRDELRDYHDKAAAFLGGLREELSGKAHALDLIVDAMATDDGDHEDRLRQSLARLRELSDSPVASPIRTALATVSNQLAEGVEQIKRQNKLTIGEFRVEIQMLHSQVEALRAASSRNGCAYLNSRLEMETRISAVVETRKPFSLLLLRIRNLALIERQFGAQARMDVMAAFTERAHKGMPDNAVFGRWSEEQFIGMIAVDKAGAISLAKRLALQISEPCASTENGKPPRPAPLVDVAVVDSSAGDIYEGLINKINNYL